MRRAGVLVSAASLLTLAAGAGTAMSAGALVTPTLHFNPMTIHPQEGDAFHGKVITFTVEFGGDTASIAAQSSPSLGPTTTIDWGDGTTPSSGDVDFHSGVFNVSGDHLYKEHGTYTITVSVSTSPPTVDVLTISGSGQSTAVVADAPLHFQGNAPEVKGFTGQPITVSGEFRDDNPYGQLSDLTGAIDPGDGGADVPATVTLLGGGPAIHDDPLDYLVSGDVVYTDPGIYHAILKLTDKGGSSADHQVTVKVEQNPLAVVPTISGVEGTAFSGKLATFTMPHDSGPDVNLQNYDLSYTIDWGDGTAKDSVASFSGGDINGTHTYADEGTYTYTVTVTATKQHHDTTSDKNDKTLVFFGVGKATIADAALNVTGVDGTATAGTLFTKIVAHFTDANPLSVLADFTTAPGGATISWGDGSAVSTGTVTTSSGGGYDVTGTHTYATAGTYTVTITVKDMGGAQASATAKYVVSSAGGGVLGITTTTGGSINVPSTGGGPAQG